MVLHRDITNAEIHEAKGISSAEDNTMYFSDGAGSGTWAPLLEQVGTWDYSENVSSVEFTGLGGFSLIQVDTFGLAVNTESDRTVYIQLGNDSGYTTSSIYYNSYWSSGVDDSTVSTGLPFITIRSSSPNNGLNFATIFITNFNIERYTLANGQLCGNTPSSDEPDGILDVLHWVREVKAYNKFRVIPASSAEIDAGSINVTGYRYEM